MHFKVTQCMKWLKTQYAFVQSLYKKTFLIILEINYLNCIALNVATYKLKYNSIIFSVLMCVT